MKESTTLALAFGGIATAAAAALLIVRARAEDEPILMVDPMQSPPPRRVIASPRARRVVDAIRRPTRMARAVRVGTLARHRLNPLGVETLSGLAAVALARTYQWVRLQRQQPAHADLVAVTSGEITRDEYENRVAGHVLTALAFGGDWDDYAGDRGQYGPRASELADFVIQNYMWRTTDPRERADLLVRMAHEILARPRNNEAGKLDFCKPIASRIGETATLDGSTRIGGEPCERNVLAEIRLAMWALHRQATLDGLTPPDGASAEELRAAMPRLVGFIHQVSSEKNGIPQAGPPSEVNFDLGAFVVTIGKLFLAAMGQDFGEMVDVAREYCEDQSANPDGC